nr:hypothetical protein [Tanacetum cinerariifolium]
MLSLTVIDTLITNEATIDRVHCPLSYARAMIEIRADVEFACCKVFGHIQEECPKNLGLGEAKYVKKPSQAPRGVPYGLKKYVEPTKEVSNSNPLYVLNSVENDMVLGTNGGISNLTSKEANHSGSSFWNMETSSPSTTPIVDKTGKFEKLIIDEKATLVDDEG